MSQSREMGSQSEAGQWTVRGQELEKQAIEQHVEENRRRSGPAPSAEEAGHL
ncbi:MAG TPA: hypothetical protein VEW42_03810 [Candidatus Eisenbacteria bacterium]|nr:hypothetical protein [Candidatus Eisenbacteria bacterium]